MTKIRVEFEVPENCKDCMMFDGEYRYCAPVTSNRLRYFDEIYDFLLKEDDKVEINAEGFKDCEVKNEKVKQNMKNVLEMEKKNAVKEFVEKLKAKAHSVVGFNVRKKFMPKSTQ